jgi:hypothetical protein
MGTSPRAILGVPTSTAVVIGTFPKKTLSTPTRIRSLKELERNYGGPRVKTIPSLVIHQFFENGGKDIWVISIGTNPFRTATPLLKGLSLLCHIPSFNMLIIPETTLLSAKEADKVFRASVPLVEKYRAVYFLDPPQLDEQRQSVKYIAIWATTQGSIQHPNVIVYYPRVHIRTQAAPAATETIPVSGAIAGLFARFDNTRGIWKAPAGTEAILHGVVGPEKVLTPQDVNTLTSGNINSLKLISSSTYVAWGARTFSFDSEWKYIPVRRLALFLESSIRQGTTWAVFEPNDEPLWAQIRQSIETFMQTLFRQGAFQGTKTQQAYFVKCGRETMTTADQAAGLVNILVGFAPLKPAEFVLVKINQEARPISGRNRP